MSGLVGKVLGSNTERSFVGENAKENSNTTETLGKRTADAALGGEKKGNKRRALRDVTNRVESRESSKKGKTSLGISKRLTRKAAQEKREAEKRAAEEEAKRKAQEEEEARKAAEEEAEKPDEPEELDEEEQRRLNAMEVPFYTNIDEEDVYNPQMVTEYVDDIYAHLRKSEVLYAPDPSYMDNQPDLHPGMRAVLTDWLVEVALEYALLPDTLFLAVNLVDRYLERVPAKRKELQLIGTAAMFISAKFEEIYEVPVAEFVYICDNTYTKDQILKMEDKMLQTLGWELNIATVKNFLRRILRAANASALTRLLSNYLAEMTLIEYEFLKYKPSMIAAAAAALAMHTRKKQAWNATIQYYAGYTLEEIQPILKELLAVMKKPKGNLKALHTKYAYPELGSVSLIDPPENPPHPDDYPLDAPDEHACNAPHLVGN